MKIFFDGVNWNASNGPNQFAIKLANEFHKKNHNITSFNPDIQLSFIQIFNKLSKNIVLRLDGIYFNKHQSWEKLNDSIQNSFNVANSVIIQSEFNKKLIEKFFGKRENVFVIHNGTNFDIISKIEPLKDKRLDTFEKVWSCASEWRPHKRLEENIRYFLEHSNEKDCLVVAGKNANFSCNSNRIFYVNQLSWENLISLFKRSNYYIHLSYLDHCPNTVIDARSCGCHIICSTSGGTEEISGTNSTLIIEDDWNFEPCELYNPPKLDFSRKRNGQFNIDINIENVVNSYIYVFEKTLNV